MKRALLFLAAFPILLSITAFKNGKPAYELYDSEGRKAGYEKMMRELVKADIILFGELHDNPISHWLEYEITRGVYEQRKENLILAAEMFETDNQLLIDEYLSGKINPARFEEEAKLWKNYKTDYKPLLDFALKNRLAFVASNIPRRYASMVARGGFEALRGLDPVAESYIAPLPIKYDPELRCYKDMLSMGHGEGMPANPNFPRAQAIKDATMAHSILENYAPGKCVLHYNGAWHSDWHQGIVWYLLQADPGLKIVTVTTVLQDDTGKLEEISVGKADYIIVVPGSMTRTY